MSGFEGFFERNPRIAGGDLVLRGTRILVRSVLAGLAEGASTEEILTAFPTLTIERVRAVIAFAASSALQELPLMRRPELDTVMSDPAGEFDDGEHGRLEEALEQAIDRFDKG